MTDILIESIRAVFAGIIFAYLLLSSREEEIRRQKGWSFILGGFALLLAGMIIDITDNFPSLDRYVVIGNTDQDAFLEKIIGYLFGLLLLAVGFWKWIPTVIALKKTERALEESRNELEMMVEKRTEALVATNNALEAEIAARHRTEDTLRASKKMYQSLVANIPSVSWITDINGNTTFISPNVKGVYGFTPEEIYEAGRALWVDRIHREDIQTVIKAYNDLFGKNGHFDAEYRIMRKDGQWIWLHDKVVTVFEKDGKKYAYGIFTDITIRKHAEQELEKRETYWRTLIENTMDIITILDSSGAIEYKSPSVKSVLGYWPEELMGKNIIELIHPDERANVSAALLRAITIPGHSESIEVRHRHNDGSWRIFAVKGKNFKVENGDVKIILNSRDITERKCIEEDRERLIAELQKAMSEVKKLSGMLPICSSCKKIRNDKGYWELVEVYIREHSEAEFSHGICPECAKELYPEYFKDRG